jgi:hypothetical protein
MNNNSTASAIVGYGMIGIAYCLFGTASWAMIPYAVDEQIVGTAYGIAFSFENIGNVVGPYIVGWISDSNKVNGVVDYFWVSIFLGIGSAIAFIMNGILIVIDLKDGGVLMASDASEK